MRNRMLILLSILFVMAPAIATAQMQGGTSGQHMMYGQHMMGPGMMRNMEMMSGMMTDMNHMMKRGHMSVDQQRQVLQMMHQMGGIMQEMGMPKEGRMAGEHYKQLQEMRKRLDEMKKHVK